MFKKVRYIAVYESELVEALKILNHLGVQTYTMKIVPKLDDNQWHISIDVRDGVWNRIMKDINENPNIRGLCISV